MIPGDFATAITHRTRFALFVPRGRHVRGVRRRQRAVGWGGVEESGPEPQGQGQGMERLGEET